MTFESRQIGIDLLKVQKTDRRRQDKSLEGLPPRLGGAIYTLRTARAGDAIAKKIIDEFGGKDNLMKQAKE